MNSRLITLKKDVQHILSMIFTNVKEFDVNVHTDPAMNSLHVTLDANYTNSTITLLLYHVHKSKDTLIINPFNDLTIASFVVKNMQNTNVISSFMDIFSYKPMDQIKKKLFKVPKHRVKVMSAVQKHIMECFNITTFLRFGKQSILYLYINGVTVQTEKHTGLIHIKSHNKTTKTVIDSETPLATIRIVDEVRKQLTN